LTNRMVSINNKGNFQFMVSNGAFCPLLKEFVSNREA
jgi:hypothetical protein